MRSIKLKEPLKSQLTSRSVSRIGTHVFFQRRWKKQNGNFSGRSRETHQSRRCIASKRLFQRGNTSIPRREARPPRRFYSAENYNARLVLFSRARLRIVSGSASAGLLSSSEYDPVVSAEKRRTAARLFQIILFAHSPALLRQTSFLHGYTAARKLFAVKAGLSFSVFEK